MIKWEDSPSGQAFGWSGDALVATVFYTADSCADDPRLQWMTADIRRIGMGLGTTTNRESPRYRKRDTAKRWAERQWARELARAGLKPDRWGKR